MEAEQRVSAPPDGSSAVSAGQGDGPGQGSEALAARVAAEDEQWVLKHAKAEAKAAAVATPESTVVTAGRAGNRPERRDEPSNARQAAG